MSFQITVRSIHEIRDCLKDGLQALGTNSRKIKVKATRDLKGSVDIDTCLKSLYPNSPRWDYVFGYKDKIYYVEVHQGKASEVKNVIKKAKWLKHWLTSSAKNLGVMKAQSSYHWISTKGTASFRIGSRYRRDLDQYGIRGPISFLMADTIT